MKNRHYDFCIVGAGPSGLTAAYRLLQAGKSVLMIERDDRTGGLAKSYSYDGHIFDTGPKRFHTDDKVVVDFIHEVTRGSISSIGRSTKVYFLGKYFEWPLQSKDILQMPLGVSAKCFIELLSSKRIVTDTASFHEHVKSKYGETLYATFFEPYTRKFLRWSPEDLHADWATTGINRTVIDKRIKTNTLFDLAKGLLLPPKVKTEFLYPKEGGFGGFFDELHLLCKGHEGFSLVPNDSVSELEDSGRRFNAVSKGMKSFSFDQLIWTGNLNDLCGIIGFNKILHYINTVFFNIICKDRGVGKKRAQWIYVSKGDSLISRITCMKEFCPRTCKEGYYNMICELTDSQTDSNYFHDPQKYTKGILSELETMSFLRNKKYVEDVKINSVLDTYPVYHRNYIGDFNRVADAVKRYSPRIHLLGRSGAFWYNNSDHSIRFAIELADKLSGRQDKEFDYRHYFGGKCEHLT